MSILQAGELVPEKTTYRVFWTIKQYEDVEAVSAAEAVDICRNSDSACDGTYIEDSHSIYKVVRLDELQ